jgi:hypothetical protein
MKPYVDLLEESFPGIKANIARCEKLGFPWASRSFLTEENGEIVSHVPTKSKVTCGLFLYISLEGLPLSSRSHREVGYFPLEEEF